MAVMRCKSFALWGIDALPVEVEVDVVDAQEHTTLIIVGLPDSAVKESKDRVLAALKNSGQRPGAKHCVINLAPGHLRKEGAIYDLPIALGLLSATGHQGQRGLLEQYMVAGELGLDGELRPIRGAFAMALLARELGLRGVIVPAANGEECATVGGIEVLALDSLRAAMAFLQGKPTASSPRAAGATAPLKDAAEVDLSDVRGQPRAKRALEIAAAGAHNLVLSGPPGTGKSMLAKALVGLLPPLEVEEALEVTKILSVARLLQHDSGLARQRPFRAPHHSISYAGLIGGGTTPRPGEVSLAHRGVLFLDELPEYSRAVLENLRQPLEDGRVTISRAQSSFTFPCRFICVGAMNPCPCGWWGHPTKGCRDSALERRKYLNKISGPLWDRLDLRLSVSPVTYEEMHGGGDGESSALVRQRVMAARERQRQRFGGGGVTNSMMSRRDIARYCGMDAGGQQLLKQAMDQMGLSARSVDRLLKVALTIADLEGQPINGDHLSEALSFRGDVAAEEG